MGTQKTARRFNLKKCIIFCGGDFDPTLPDDFSAEGSYIIAADKGYEYCGRLGIKPDIAIGDFDSLGFTPDNCKTAVYPQEKDDTDLMLAIREALSLGCGDITLLCASGGRTDHALANIQALSFIVKRGARGRIFSSDERIELYSPQEIIIPFKAGFSLSLFAYSEKVSGLSIEGAKYELEDAEITYDFPIGISNEITSAKAHISFKEGLLIVVQSRLIRL